MNKVLSFLFLQFIAVCSFAQLTQPNLSSPPDNATEVNTSPSIYVTGGQGDSVQVEIAENNSFTNSKTFTNEKSGFGTFIYLKKLKLNTTYYWRARTITSTNSSNWTNSRKFTTVTRYRGLNPSGDALNRTGSEIYLATATLFGYDSAEFQIDTTANFNSSALLKRKIEEVDSLRFLEIHETGLNFGQVYYWRVRAIKGNTKTTWSDTLKFSFIDSIGLRFPAPTYTSSTQVTFQWSKGNEQDPFQVQLDTNADFSTILLDTIAAEGTKRFEADPFTLKELNYGTTYYYRVRSFNETDTMRWTSSSFITDDFGFSDPPNMDAFPDPKVTAKARRTIEGSTGIELQFDTLQDFSSPEFTVLHYVDEDTVIQDLLWGETYYVRARTYHAKDTSNWGRVRTINVSPFPNTFYPYNNWTDIAVNDSMFFGDMDGVNGYQIQIAVEGDYTNKLFLDTVMKDTGAAFYYYIKGLTFKYNTRYEWKIRGWHSRDTSEWSNSKPFTTIVSPTLSRPFNSDFLGTPAEVKLEWEPIRGNPTFQVYLDTSSLFNSSVLLDTVVSGNELDLKDLLFRPLYHWKVRIVTANDTSAWSDTWVFKVLPVRLNSPRNNLTNVTLFSLDWNSISGTNGYILQVDSFEDFRAPLELTDTVKNSFFHFFTETPDYIQFNTKYFWRVKLYHSKDTSEWSAVWNFTTRPRLAPKLVAPADSSEEIAIFPFLRWESYSGASSYAVELSTNADFTSPTKQVATGTSLRVNLTPNERYYWRVRGRNSDGNEFHDWSESWTFTTTDTIPTPSLINPSNGSIGVAKNVQFRWSKDDAASSYLVEVSTDSLFNTKFTRTISSTVVIFNQLENEQTYFWRVRTNSPGISSAWSEVWKFTTASSASVDQVSSNTLLVYPNPASDMLVIDGNGKSFTLIAITDATGKIVSTFDEGKQLKQHHINLSSFTPGMYTIETMVDDKRSYLRFIKK
jgi:hypothetical protein